MNTKVDGRFGNLYKELLGNFAFLSTYDYATFVNCWKKIDFGVKLAQLRIHYNFCTDSRFIYEIYAFIKKSLLEDESTTHAQLCALFTMYVFYYSKMKDINLKMEFAVCEFDAMQKKFTASQSREAFMVLDKLVQDNAFSFVSNPHTSVGDCLTNITVRRCGKAETDSEGEVDNFSECMEEIHVNTIIDNYFSCARENDSRSEAEDICLQLYDREKRSYAKTSSLLTLDSNNSLQPAPHLKKYYETYKKVLIAKNDPLAMKMENKELAVEISQSLTISEENKNASSRKNDDKKRKNTLNLEESDYYSSDTEYGSSESDFSESDESDMRVMSGISLGSDGIISERRSESDIWKPSKKTAKGKKNVSRVGNSRIGKKKCERRKPNQNSEENTLDMPTRRNPIKRKRNVFYWDPVMENDTSEPNQKKRKNKKTVSREQSLKNEMRRRTQGRKKNVSGSSRGNDDISSDVYPSCSYKNKPKAPRKISSFRKKLPENKIKKNEDNELLEKLL